MSIYAYKLRESEEVAGLAEFQAELNERVRDAMKPVREALQLVSQPLMEARERSE
jgi:hypothetical protein